MTKCDSIRVFFDLVLMIEDLRKAQHAGISGGTSSVIGLAVS